MIKQVKVIYDHIERIEKKLNLFIATVEGNIINVQVTVNTEGMACGTILYETGNI